jgi:hypothetical protein
MRPHSLYYFRLLCIFRWMGAILPTHMCVCRTCCTTRSPVFFFFFFFSPIFPQWDGRNSDRQQKKKRCKKREKSPSISQLVCVAFCGRHTQVRATTHTPQSFFYYLFIYFSLSFLYLPPPEKKGVALIQKKGEILI